MSQKIRTSIHLTHAFGFSEQEYTFRLKPTTKDFLLSQELRETTPAIHMRESVYVRKKFMNAWRRSIKRLRINNESDELKEINVFFVLLI
jgi:hypothetical protein